MNSLTSLIGNTPVIALTHMNPNPRVTLIAKLEGQNIGGSVKDRIALSMIDGAEKTGTLTKNKIILEATSGNTGIALAMIAAVRGYRSAFTMAENASEERKRIMRAYGAELILTPAAQGTAGAIEKARSLVAEHPEQYWFVNQHNNPDNPLAHEENTGHEILQQVPSITHFVAGIGTFGTLLGTGRTLRKERSTIRIIGVEPHGRIDGLRSMAEAFPPEHFSFNQKFCDEKLTVTRDQAREMTRRLAREEGLLCGLSSGANLFGALDVAQRISEGTIVVIFPDRGEKYLTTDVFEG